MKALLVMLAAKLLVGAAIQGGALMETFHKSRALMARLPPPTVAAIKFSA